MKASIKIILVRGKVHGIQGVPEIKGLKFMRKDLAKELREIAKKDGKSPK